MAEVAVEGELPYEPPAQLVAYVSGEVPDSNCAEGTTARFWELNAFYCRADRSILYDETWLRDFAEASGDYAPVAILAHEWGHHVQQALGVTGFSIQTELQADCLAGLFLANTELVFPGVLGPEDDVTAALAAFFAIGNDRYAASDWFQAGEHGSPQQRIRAYGTGYLASYRTPDYPPPVGKGLAVCYGYRDFMHLDVARVGPYRFLNLPGRTEEMVDGKFMIAPEMRLGFQTSAVLLSWLEGDTSEEIVEGFGVHFPGLSPQEPTIDLTANVDPGTGFANFFEQRHDGLAAGVRSGMLGLLEPQSAEGALAILVSRDQPRPVEPMGDAENQTLAEQISTLYEILNRLCSPDDSSDTSDPDLNVVCLDDQ